ncbi:hypothetical protein E2C01_001621 [Portunus trituberculatus]|uniref:Uncharacterized protein n=1 Tax=Portunus trituberculatus TaxID=210409 RepID=A0A5B7CHR9_PORTR|nr:hypothetical protein [Portunus trituberculatus]
MKRQKCPPPLKLLDKACGFLCKVYQPRSFASRRRLHVGSVLPRSRGRRKSCGDDRRCREVNQITGNDVRQVTPKGGSPAHIRLLTIYS